jgi:hypothetical protein
MQDRLAALALQDFIKYPESLEVTLVVCEALTNI